MWQQVGYAEDRVAFVLTDGDADYRAVFLVNVAVQSQRNGWPLIFLDAAVVVRVEIGKLAVLIQRVGL